jgi:hypothetical protein
MEFDLRRAFHDFPIQFEPPENLIFNTFQFNLFINKAKENWFNIASIYSKFMLTNFEMLDLLVPSS